MPKNDEDGNQEIGKLPISNEQSTEKSVQKSIQKSGLKTEKWPEKAQRIIDVIASNPQISIPQLESTLKIGHWEVIDK